MVDKRTLIAYTGRLIPERLKILRGAVIKYIIALHRLHRCVLRAYV